MYHCFCHLLDKSIGYNTYIFLMFLEIFFKAASLVGPPGFPTLVKWVLSTSLRLYIPQYFCGKSTDILNSLLSSTAFAWERLLPDVSTLLKNDFIINFVLQEIYELSLLCLRGFISQVLFTFTSS